MNGAAAPKARATEVAYYAIEALIATLQLKPGQAIVEHDLALATGLGRTPIRESLMRLVACGLIEQEPRRGMRVSEIRVDQHLVLIDTRRVLEQMIAAGAARWASPDQRALALEHTQKMISAARQGDLYLYMQADRAFDHTNYEACRNPFAVTAVEPMVVQCRRFWYAYQYEGDMEQSAACHAMLAEGVAAGNTEQALQGVNALMDYMTLFARKVIG